ncbi:MAG: hypothetical protein ONB27_12480 [candidate division KSB1 bacterium]|nr:hypothetical protein [candidate division KSB1 bacterium]
MMNHYRDETVTAGRELVAGTSFNLAGIERSSQAARNASIRLLKLFRSGMGAAAVYMVSYRLNGQPSVPD